MLTTDYYRLASTDTLSKGCRDCLRDLVSSLTAANGDHLKAILLYGGIARELHDIDGWSDIDIIVVYDHVAKCDAVQLAGTVEALQTKYRLRIDVTQVSQHELTDDSLRDACFNGELMNAVARRAGVAILIYGCLCTAPFPLKQEQLAAKIYVTNTLAQLRRFLIEVGLTSGLTSQDRRAVIARVTRWTFSIIRASLRLFGIFSHPYEPSLPHVKRLFPTLDLSILYRLLDVRRSGAPEHTYMPLLMDVQAFLEEYVPTVLRHCHGQA